MKSLIVVIVFAGVIGISIADFESDWEDFKVNYKRQYGSAQEESFRKELFRKTWEMVKEHNEKYEKGEVTWKMGINDFADKTFEEKKKSLGFLLTYSAGSDSEWENFKIKFNRQYKSPELEAYRKGIFLKNLEAINAHNKKYEKGEVTWKMGVNDFTDMTREEFARSHLGSPPKFEEGEFLAAWTEFKEQFGRQYESPVEEAFRRGIFRVNWEKIIEHNQKYDQGKVTWKMGTNNFTDWTGEEFGSHVMRPEVFYSTSFDSEWADFKVTFLRQYDTVEEEAFRKGIFLKNWEMITEHNKKFEKGEVTWTMGVNNFTDFTREEFGTRSMNPPKFSKEQYQEDWNNFKVKFGRSYENTVEEAFRRGIFRWNWENIVEHNRKFEKGEVTWKMGVNNFTDWTREEFGSHIMRPITLHPNDV